MDFVVLAEVAVFVIFPNVARAGIEERVVTPAIRKLDRGVLMVAVRNGGLRLKDWFRHDYRKKQSDDCEDRLRVKVNAHVRLLVFADWISQIQNS
jgi:hypothetical protein